MISDRDGNLPIDDEKAEGERASKNAAERLFAPRFIFRQEAQPDRGTDASIELRRVINGRWHATGRRAWCQLKHTSSPHVLSDGGISYPIDTKNINYLFNYPCSFYLLYVWPTDEMYFRWHRSVLDELNRERAGWTKQHVVTIRFSRRLDAALLDEIETEIDCYAAQVAQLADGPRFIRFVIPEAARRLMEPDSLFVGRTCELQTLAGRIARGRVLAVTGEPDAGKRELIRQLLSDPRALDELQRSLEGPVALLAADAGAHIKPRILRSVAWALGVQSSWEIEVNEEISLSQARANLIAECLPSRIQGQRLLAIIENADRCLDDPFERADLDELLASRPFRTGCAVIVTQWGSPPDGKGTRVRQPETRVTHLSRDEANELLQKLGIEPFLASSVVDEAIGLPELLLPGVIRRAVGAYAVRVTDCHVSASSEALLNELLCAREFVTTEVLRGLCGCDKPTFRDPISIKIAALMAIAILGEVSIRGEELDAWSLDQGILEKLRGISWIEQPLQNAYRLTATGSRSLRKVFLDLVAHAACRPDVLRTVEGALHRILETYTSRLTEDEFDAFSKMLERAIAWVRDIGLAGTRFEAALLEVLLPYVVGDQFFPIPAKRAEATRESFRDIAGAGSLHHVVADVALATRSVVEQVDYFRRFREAVSIALTSPRLQAVHVRVLDFALFVGQKRYHNATEILDIRHAFLDRLMTLDETEIADVALLKWAASWVVNTAAVAAAAGEIELSRKDAKAARVAFDRLPLPTSPYGRRDYLWLASRLAQVEALAIVDSHTRVERLREAADAAFGILATIPGNPSNITFALRAAHRLAEELHTDAQRESLLDEVEKRLLELFGGSATWPLALKTQTLSLARDVAGLSADPELRAKEAGRFLDLFQPATEEAKTLAALGDARPLLAIARSYALAARCNKDINEPTLASKFRGQALQLAADAIAATPTALGWDLYLRLKDEEETSTTEAPWHADSPGSRHRAIGPDLRKGIDAARDLLSKMPSWGPAEGRLSLWCLEREWKSQGSLKRWAARSQAPGGPWDELRAETKKQILKRFHRKRMTALNVLEGRTGPLLELKLIRVRTEAQFQRLLAIYGDHIADIRPVLKHFESAKQLWPFSYLLLKEEGCFQRYIWNYPDAIDAFRHVVAMAPGGVLRREAMTDLVEVLLTATAHCKSIVFRDGRVVDASALVSEAQALLNELRGFRNVSRDVAILSDRAQLEAGISPNWKAIDDAFQAVVGGVDAYASTIACNLDELQASQPDLPEHIADLVLSNFTSTEVLRDLGWLYLRRVDLGSSPDSSRDCQKAYAAFQACRIMEMEWSRAESATTSYQRGRAILAAANATKDLMPFQAHAEGKRDLLHLAESLFSRAVSFSVGLFHSEAKRRHSEATRLRRTLSMQP